MIGSAVVAERERVAYLWGMYVDPDHQRRGVGKALLRHAAGTIVAASSLEASVLETISAALGFYRRLGFLEIGRGSSQIVPDRAPLPAIIMAADVKTLGMTKPLDETPHFACPPGLKGDGKRVR